MSIELHTIKPARGSRTKAFRIGRGNASGRGTTAGKGTKGQRARSGGRNKLKRKGLRAMLLSFPKNRGFRSQYEKPETVTVGSLAKAFAKPQAVDVSTLKKAGLVTKRAMGAKIVSGGELAVALKIAGIGATATAKAAIEKAGGAFEKAKKTKKTQTELKKARKAAK
jgi:large subunit ribosomal protein L15